MYGIAGFSAYSTTYLTRERDSLTNLSPDFPVNDGTHRRALRASESSSTRVNPSLDGPLHRDEGLRIFLNTQVRCIGYLTS